jgi:hypothetical protein
VERHHCWILHRWLARGTRRLQVDAQRRDIVRHPAGRYRGRVHRLQPHDGRQHQARPAPATARRRWCLAQRRRCPARVDFPFVRHNGPKRGSFIISRRSAWDWDGEDDDVIWMDLHFPQARFGSGWRFALSSASVLYLVSYTDMICTTSGGVSRRRHELMESCSVPQSHSIHLFDATVVLAHICI